VAAQVTAQVAALSLFLCFLGGKKWVGMGLLMDALFVYGNFKNRLKYCFYKRLTAKIHIGYISVVKMGK
jgi:hypothetical protein